MLTLRPTVKLARRLRLEPPRTVPPQINRMADWCVHEFCLDRTPHLIFCHTASLYPVVTRSLGVTDARTLILRFVEGASQSLAGGGLEFIYQRWIAPEAFAVQWAPIPDRSVQGTINELIYAAKVEVAIEEAVPDGLGAKLARIPLTILGGNSPDRVLPQMRG